MKFDVERRSDPFQISQERAIARGAAPCKTVEGEFIDTCCRIKPGPCIPTSREPFLFWKGEMCRYGRKI